MSHVYKHKKKIITRIRKIQGQLKTVEKRLEEGSEDCFATLQTLAASRGALNGLMNQLVQGHILEHIVREPNNPESDVDQAAMKLAQLLKTYWK